jgi:hypothetical protein
VGENNHLPTLVGEIPQLQMFTAGVLQIAAAGTVAWIHNVAPLSRAKD